MKVTQQAMVAVAETLSSGTELANFIHGSFYHTSIIPLAVLTVLLAWQARPSVAEERPAGFLKFQVCYLGVWMFCAAADWLQGPYVYALYSAYEFSRHEIAQLFVAGFASSLFFSCIVGTVCDRYGRKKCAMGYCILYIISCLTKHVKLFGVLMLGRITGGIATSLLFSCFECWLVSEHAGRNRFSGGLLSYMFGLMYTVNYCAAIVSGIVGELLADGFKLHPAHPGSVVHLGGDLGPFDLAILCLLVGMLLIFLLWEENYGQMDATEAPQSLTANFLEALQLLREDSRICLTGLAVACFEGAMYAFVFNWTPSLESENVPPPYGIIFALFMMACMSGASISTLVERYLPPERRLLVVFGASACALGIAAGVHGRGALRLTFSLFCIFEFSVGIYFPSMGVLKSNMVPERVRGTMYNLYRVPLNAIVVALLLTKMSIARVYVFCAVLLAIAFASIGLINLTTPKAAAHAVKEV